MSELKTRIADLESILTNLLDMHTDDEICAMEQELDVLLALEPVEDELNEIEIDTDSEIRQPWRHFRKGTSILRINDYCIEKYDCGVTTYLDRNDNYYRLTLDIEHYESRVMAGRNPEKDWTFDFIPDKVQRFRMRPWLTGRCECNDEYEISYTLDYAQNKIGMNLTHYGKALFTKHMNCDRSRPLTIHEAERIVTDEIIRYVAKERGMLVLTTAILSRLRKWTDGEPKKLTRQMRHVFIDNRSFDVLDVDMGLDEYRSYAPYEYADIKERKLMITSTVNVPFRKTRCQLVFVENA